MPAELAPILERLHVTGEGWLRLVLDSSRLFRLVRRHADVAAPRRP
jgi:hypothetical protein